MGRRSQVANRLKCAFCDWETALWTRKKGQKAKMTGYPRLAWHVECQHPAEYDWYTDIQHANAIRDGEGLTCPIFCTADYEKQMTIPIDK